VPDLALAEENGIVAQRHDVRGGAEGILEPIRGIFIA
jgi:hypothetical protein